MNLNPNPPELAVVRPSRQTAITQVVAPMHIKTDYKFNSVSQLEFQVQKYLYDEISGKWYKNPSYDELTSNNLIYSSEVSDIFKFKGCKLLNPSQYTGRISQSRPRDLNESGLFFSADIKGGSLQDEYAVFNLGIDYGYNWESGTYINDSGAFVSAPNDANYRYHEALEEFFPVEVGDVVALGSRPYNGLFKKDETAVYSYRIHYYSDSEASTQTKVGEWGLFNPVGRIVISDGDFGSNTFTEGGSQTVTTYVKKGYIRLELKGENSVISRPLRWYAAVINGERRCVSVDVEKENGEDKYYNVSFGIPWWVIKEVNEEIDGYNSVKTITAYSYDYTISDKTFSIDECTLPLYIPDEIPNTVQSSSDFAIDCEADLSTTPPTDVGTWYGHQRMERGLINRVLDVCPAWDIGYVTPKLLTRYRTLPDCTEVNAYSFLMSTVQELYKCFIIFDTNNMTINLIDKDDVVSIDSNTVISWRNALKALTITNADTNCVTALRVHAGDDEYGIGLVNTNGNNLIYNFDNIEDQLDYVADVFHMDDNGNSYTLKNRWRAYKQMKADIENGTIKIAGDTISFARSTVINGQFELAEIETKLSEALTNYKKIADRINIFLDNDDSNYRRLPDVPIRSFTGDYAPSTTTDPYTGVTSVTYNNYSSETLYNKIVEASELYYSVKATYTNKTNDVRGAINDLKVFASYISLSPSVLQPIFDRYRQPNSTNPYQVGAGYFPVFTPTEAKEMSKYIVEGTWTNDNIVFKEDYDTYDIQETLSDVYNTAKSEFDSVYSKPTYEFEATIAAIFVLDEVKQMFTNIALGNSLYIVDDSENKQFDYIKPVLLSITVDYDDWGNTKFELSTDYKRKPLELRFTELFGSISRTNPSNASFSYDD